MSLRSLSSLPSDAARSASASRAYAEPEKATPSSARPWVFTVRQPLLDHDRVSEPNRGHLALSGSFSDSHHARSAETIAGYSAERSGTNSHVRHRGRVRRAHRLRYGRGEFVQRVANDLQIAERVATAGIRHGAVHPFGQTIEKLNAHAQLLVLISAPLATGCGRCHSLRLLVRPLTAVRFDAIQDLNHPLLLSPPRTSSPVSLPCERHATT